MDKQDCLERGAQSKFMKMKSKNKRSTRRYYKKCERMESLQNLRYIHE